MNDKSGQGGGCPIWVKALLALSLVANMAIAGLYVGQMSKTKERKRGTERQISWILKFVPEARHADAEKLFDGKRDEIRTLYRDRGKYLDEVIVAIRAEPFSPETVVAAMRARRENSGARRLIVEQTLVDLLQTFNADERAYFADQMEIRINARNAKRAK